MLDKEGINIYDGGVIIVSRYPIVNEAQYVFPDCSGTDCFADKGVNYAEVIKGGQAYHVFATHTASFDTDTARDYRQRQFKQIRALAQSLDIPANEAVIYSGDFNVNKLKFPDDYQQMMTNLNVSEPQYSGYTASTFDLGSMISPVGHCQVVLMLNISITSWSAMNMVQNRITTTELMCLAQRMRVYGNTIISRITFPLRLL